MKKILFTLTIIVLISVLALTLTKTTNSNISETNNNQESIEPEETSKITITDTSTWKQVQLHQKISVSIPQNWYAGTDGIYNYDQTKATGIRDPNFPDNSFKCVFYIDESLRSKIIIENEETLHTNPKVTYINATWNSSQDTSRSVGEKVNFYTFKNGTDEKVIECNVFKGNMQESDKMLLENVILSIQ